MLIPHCDRFLHVSRTFPYINEELVPFIKVAKAYLRNKGVPLKSFHIEVLASLIIPLGLKEWHSQGYTWGYGHMLAYFLHEASKYLNKPVRIPGSFSDDVSHNLSEEKGLQWGIWMNIQASEAWKICELRKQSESQAVAAWYRFFGSPFPAS
jgi:hypothetical protein